MPDYNFNLNPNPLAAFNIPGITDTNTPSLGGIGYDPTSLASIQSFGLPSFGGTQAPASNMWTDIFGKDGKGGYANTAMDLTKGLVGMGLGIKGMNMAKEQFAFNKANILYDRNKRNEMYEHTRNLQAQNREAARGYTLPNQSVPSTNSTPNAIPSIADQMKRYGA